MGNSPLCFLGSNHRNGNGLWTQFEMDFLSALPSLIIPLPGHLLQIQILEIRGKDASLESARVFFPSSYSVKSDYHVRAHTCSSTSITWENDYLESNGTKITVGKSSRKALYTMIDDHLQITGGDAKLTFFTSLQPWNTSQFSLLLENLDMLEDRFSDSDTVELEREILVQLERLGAVNLFHTFLSKNIKFPTFSDFYGDPDIVIEEPCLNEPVEDQMIEVVVRTTKKEERKARRQRALDKASKKQRVKYSSSSSSKLSSNSIGRRRKITRNEAELSSGVKMIAGLENLKMRLEKENGGAVSLGCWAEAAGIDRKVLQENLHYGWCCRDELLKSTRSLVIYIARSYSGQGVPFEDLIQTGNVGVLQGAERFDQTMGYKFSTYVHHWIRKSMSMFLAQNARGIKIPMVLSKAINQIQKARKTLRSKLGENPDDNEIAKFTGLSLAKVVSASQCLRVVGSTDQNIYAGSTTKFLELMPDTTMETPEEAVMRNHMINDVHRLLNGLEPRHRQVLVLKYGLGGHRGQSLAEIGRRFSVTREWTRKIERKALTKLREDNTLQDLRHYLYL